MILYNFKKNKKKTWFYYQDVVLYFGGKKIPLALVAQLDRASGYGPEGHGFESSSARQKESTEK